MATAADHQAAQAAIAAQMGEQVDQLWQLLTIDNLNESLPKYQLAVASLVQRYGQASASLASLYYEEERSAAKVPGKFAAKPAEPAGFEQVSKGLDWSTKGLWSETPDIATSKKLSKATAERYTLNASRETIITASNTDRKANGWARTVEPGACSFCLLLATRGAVYRTEQSSEFQAHDHCRCHAQPVFAAIYEPSAEVRRAQQIYQQVKKNSKGPAATRRNFRTALAKS